MIICPKCKEEYKQYAGNFYVNNKRSNGYCCYCVLCESEMRKKVKKEPKIYGFENLPNITDEQAEKIENALYSILEKSHLPHQKSWHEIKQSMLNFKRIEL